MSKTEKGRDLMLFAEIAGKWTAFAAAKECSYAISVEMGESTSKDSGVWKEAYPTKISWNAKTSGLVTLVHELNSDVLLSMMKTMLPIKLRFAKVTEVNKQEGVPENGWTPSTVSSYKEGMAYISSLEESAPDGDSATYSASFEGTGELDNVRGVPITLASKSE